MNTKARRVFLIVILIPSAVLKEIKREEAWG